MKIGEGMRNIFKVTILKILIIVKMAKAISPTLNKSNITL